MNNDNSLSLKKIDALLKPSVYDNSGSGPAKELMSKFVLYACRLIKFDTYKQKSRVKF